MKIAIGNLNMFRPTVGAAAVVLSQRAFDEAMNWSKKESPLNVPFLNSRLFSLN